MFKVAILFVKIFLVTSISRPARLTLAEEWTSYYHNNHDGTYAFGYDVEDPATGNIQFRQEERYSNGTVAGSYGHIDPDGNARITHYVADEFGYRTTIESSGGTFLQYSAETKQNNFKTESPQLSAARISMINKSLKDENRIPPKHHDSIYRTLKRS